MFSMANCQIGVRPHVRGVLSSQLEADAHKQAGAGLLDLASRADRAGEVHLLHVSRSDDLCRLVMIENEVAEQAARQARLVEGGLKPFADEQGLGRSA